MATINKLDINKHFTFDVYPDAILGSSFQNVKVLAILDADTAKGYIDPQAMHVNIYPTLPVGLGVPNDPSQYQYIKIRFPNGNVTAIGIPWIVEDSIVEETTQALQFTIENVNPADRETIMLALSGIGMTAVNVKVL